jgi:uncharacterized surface protein with fasciclin (FAS1) repeats
MNGGRYEWSTRRTARLFVAVGLAVSGLALAGCGSEDDSSSAGTQASQPTTTQPMTTEAATPNIVETAVAAGDFSTLTSLLEQAGLAETLAEGGPFTVFAPTDAAFAKVPKATLDSLAADSAKLKGVLLYHVVEGEARASDVAELSSAKTLNGASVARQTNGSTVRVGGARVLQADVEASNGVIHVIDEVLIPA